jgi:EAL domain-containing protein (putative c-di-GMP-specific phosphodiesterase class I)
MAEETGMVLAIGKWVLLRACRDALSWQGPGHGLRLGVNVSSKQLVDPEFAEWVARVLRETGFPAERLQLEITESSVLEQRAPTVATLNALRRLGVSIVVDDFGTGYAALTALKWLPLDGLKIDRSFVSNLVSSPTDATLATGLITIARGLSIQVMAEGVETVDQMRFLTRHGCARMQGYLFGKPIPADEFVPSLIESESAWDELIGDPVERG